LAGEGTVQRSYSSADSCSGSTFPKPVPELFGGERYRQFAVGWLAQRDRGDLQCGNWQLKHALDGRSIDRHCGSGQVLAEQSLRDEAAKEWPMTTEGTQARG